jgi:hypothetical protein
MVYSLDQERRGFHNFVTSSDFPIGGSDGAWVLGSDDGSIYMAVDSNFDYFITGIIFGLHSLSDNIHASIVTLDSDGTAGATTQLTAELDFHTPAAPTGLTTEQIEFGNPIRVMYSSNANFISLKVEPNDTDASASLAYYGYKKPINK